MMPTDEAKSAIFDSIRRNLATSASFDAIRAEHHAHDLKSPESELIVATANLEIASLIKLFRENLIAVGGICETVKDERAAAAIIEAIIKEKQAEKIAISDANLIGEIKSLIETNAEILTNLSKEDLFECDLGITGAQYAIAETGTLVIESDKEFNRLTSLIPPVHICVLKANQIRQTLGETLAVLERNLSRTVTFITGPSRTSDIELTLAIGVHGPGELIVILIEE